jgi:predicted alpha-1,6-mannanase (GH76 family)
MNHSHSLSNRKALAGHASIFVRSTVAVVLSAVAVGACFTVPSESLGTGTSSALSSYPPNASCPASATAYCSEASQSLSGFLGGTTGPIANGESPFREDFSGNFGGNGMTWHDANTVEMLVDYYVATGDTTYLPVVAAYKSFDAINDFGADNSFPLGVNTYNDDRLWWALAFIRAYDEMPDHDPVYLQNAVSIFQSVCTQWNSVPGCGGGLPQQVGGANPNNTVTNELFFATAAKLATRAPSAANVCGDGAIPWTSSPVSQPITPSAPGADGVGGMSYAFQNTYLGWALAEYEWFKKYYLPAFVAVGSPAGEFPLRDSLGAPPACTPQGIQWTYNQGPILGALLELSTLSSDALMNGAEADPPSTMASLAYTIASQAMSTIAKGGFSNGGILTELDDATPTLQASSTGCFIGPTGDQNSGDCAEFKGIFMRYLGRLTYESWPTTATGDLSFRSDATTFITANANAIWQNRAGETGSSAQLPVTWGYDTRSIAGNWNYQPAMTSGLDGLIAAIPAQGPPAPVVPPPVVPPAPVTVTGLSESKGHAGDTITVTGTGFSTTWQMTSFAFGAAPGCPAVIPYYACSSTTSCEVPVPPSAGTVAVTATVGLNTSAATFAAIFEYESPTVTSINPSSGGSTGGTGVTITGLGLDSGMSVYFGGVASPSVGCGENSCWAMSPSDFPNTGAVDVTVVVDGVTSATSSADQFTFVYETPTPSSVSISESNLWTSESVTATVTLNEPAPPGGTQVTLTAVGPSRVPATGVTVPAMVTVPAGASSVQFPITIAAQAIDILAVLASTPGGSAPNASWWIYPGDVALLSSSNVPYDSAASLDVVLRNPAGLSGDTLSLSSSSSALTVPSSVVVGAGADTVSIPATAGSVGASTDVTVTFGYQGNTQSLQMVVTKPVCTVTPCRPGYSWSSASCACELQKNTCACGGVYPKCTVCQ